MNRRILAASMVMALSICATQVCTTQTAYASPFAVHVPVNAKMGKTKFVSFSLRNDSTSPITVMAGTTVMTLAPGKEMAAKLAVGDKVVMQDGSAAIPAGTVLAVGSSDISGTTIALR